MGEIIKAEINEMNLLGNGITKQDGCVVFCLGAVDGDTVTAEITQVKKNFKIAEVRSIDVASTYRSENGCSAFGKCGGCALRHITYEHELDIKKKNVENALRRGGLGEISVDEILSASDENYRNKVVFKFAENVKLGFSEGASHTFVEIDSCAIIPESFMCIKSFTEDYLAKNAENLTYFFIRCNDDESEFNVAVGIKPKAKVDLTGYAEALCEMFPAVTGVMSGIGEHPEDGEFKVIYGVPYVNATFLGLDVKVSAQSFFQVNYEAAELLAAKVAELAAPQIGEYGADLYCGTGIMGFACAAMNPHAFITGVEINEKAVEDAKENAAVNGLINLGYYGGDSADFVKGSYGSIDFAIIDPPRAGCSDKMIKELVRLAPKRIVSVSCAPDTLARDLKKLCDSGYSIEKVVACDLFPRTKHVESVVLLTKK